MNFDYTKSRGNLISVCKRNQKTIQNKYVLRYDSDDEFKNLTEIERKKTIRNYLNK